MSANVGDVLPELLPERFVAYQRQAILGSLAGIIAHEYRNLLSPIFTRAQHAATCDDVALMRKALNVTVQQTQKLLDLTHQLLEIARGKELPLQPCCLAKLVDGAVISAVRPFDKDRIELELCVPRELRIQAQPVLFEQVMLNLLLNARQAMKSRGGKLLVNARRDDDVVIIDVRDSGVGISAAVLDQVINPFLAADANGQPEVSDVIGLGLNACRTIAQHHGAAIRAFANDDLGCTFQLRWPAA
jgi:two-component system NtrC family sensor kinase